MDKKPIGFMSYARSDDEHENGKLSEFRSRLIGEVRMQSGDDSFDIFQDHIDIVWGQQWQQRLDRALDSVKLLIPIITPKFFKSQACREEVERFVLRERRLGRTDLIFPVYYVTAGELDDKARRDRDRIAQVIGSHQHMDWRELRHESLTGPDASKTLAKMAKQIVAAMARGGAMADKITIPSPVAKISPKPAWASAGGVDVFGEWADISLDNVVQRLRWVVPGDFLMGSTYNEAGQYYDESPRHRVTISQGLWLADTACTQALWQAVMKGNPSRFNENQGGGPQHPVENVSWDSIQPFLKAMTKKLPGCQFTLPTEAEWEYACRAGGPAAFSFGETISTDEINFNGNYPCGKGEKGEYRERTLPVKELGVNSWGLYQMHGNVWEWCEDKPRAYEDKAVIDPGRSDVAKSQGGGARALRGGSWSDFARFARSACRLDKLPDWLDGDVGFRFACSSSS